MSETASRAGSNSSNTPRSEMLNGVEAGLGLATALNDSGIVNLEKYAQGTSLTVRGLGAATSFVSAGQTYHDNLQAGLPKSKAVADAFVGKPGASFIGGLVGGAVGGPLGAFGGGVFGDAIYDAFKKEAPNNLPPGVFHLPKSQNPVPPSASANAAIGSAPNDEYMNNPRHGMSDTQVRDELYGPSWKPSGERSPTDDRAPAHSNAPATSGSPGSPQSGPGGPFAPGSGSDVRPSGTNGYRPSAFDSPSEYNQDGGLLPP